MKPAHPQQSLGDLQFPCPLPTVSVLIRTTGRPSLAAAIKSVELQQFKNWELLIVNASGSPLVSLAKEELEAVTRMIEPGASLDRSSAANVLLSSAKGRYAIFLDDDDWFLDNHLEKLVNTLDADSDLIAAYSDVECISNLGTASQKTSHVFAQDFDLSALQLQNYLPIHSVMFRLDGARIRPTSQFEHELKLFEDWDFWLQLAAKGPFQRVPGTSAIYALSPETGSGHAEDANAQRQAMLTLLGERQLHRWQASDVAALILNEVKRSNKFNYEKQSADIAKQHALLLEQHANQLNEQSMQLEVHAAELTLQLTEAKLSLSELHDYSALQQAELAEARLSLGELRNYSALQQAEIDKLSQIRVEHLKQLETLYQSHSWRITQPLRSTSQWLMWLKGPSPLRLTRNLSRAVSGDIRRNGILGTLRRLPYYLKHHRAYLGVLRSRPPANDGNLFDVSPATLRNIRLHPDLTGGGTTIDVKVSVVIPTLNAGPEFVWMLRKLRAQLAVREIEIVIVDSGSSDSTVQVSRDAGATVVEILPEEFSHSHARNLGADHATGDYVLFMVQDAYPIGNHWMYGMLRYLLDHADQGLVAASCAEYSRSDSDMMYDSMINTHYRFLGCLDHDRIGEYCGDDHMSLRSRGQLSDVSCLIARGCFQQFRYRGNYAEDLDLGIRLIKSGKRVAMLASVKVIHSHNRPAYYYLKRSFVDVIFLVGLFDDFSYPHCESLQGLLAGIESVAVTVSEWLLELETNLSQRTLSVQLETWISQSRRSDFYVRSVDSLILNDVRLNDFIMNMTSRYIGSATGALSASARNEARHFNDTFLARLEHFNHFAAEVYGKQDAVLRQELADVVRKTFASSVGSSLAFYCLDHKQPADAAYETAQLIHDELAAGV